MVPWRWKNLEVLEKWASTHTRHEFKVIRTAIEEAANNDPGYAPGEQVEPYTRHDTLYLLDII